jgi:hypothetical protein
MMIRIALLFAIPAAALASAADSTAAADVSVEVFSAMQEADGAAIVACLSLGALAELDGILQNLRENPDLTLAMLSFNWGVETVPTNYDEWGYGDLLSVIYSSTFSKSILLDTTNSLTEVTVAGDTAVALWSLCGEDWPMVLVLEDGEWKVDDIEDF